VGKADAVVVREVKDFRAARAAMVHSAAQAAAFAGKALATVHGIVKHGLRILVVAA
jgi:hypothetical protein